MKATMKTIAAAVAMVAAVAVTSANAGYIENLGAGSLIQYEDKCNKPFTQAGKYMVDYGKKFKHTEGYKAGVDIANALSCSELKQAWVDEGVYRIIFKY